MARKADLLPDDYVDPVRAAEAAFSDGVVSVRKKSRKKSPFDTNPSDQTRIAAVRAFAPRVRLELAGNADRPFKDLGAVCRARDGTVAQFAMRGS